MKGIGATGAIGGSRGSVGITPTGVEFGLNAGGIGQLGISTDYGGGIVIAIAGQKIVWGREGGKIHYNLGGFEVIVEARNCVVVETRKIAGQVVGTHVYPDPGCKSPDPPKPPNSPSPVSTPIVENEVELPDTEEDGWVPFSEIVRYYSRRTVYAYVVINRKATDINKNRRPVTLPYTSLSNSSHPEIYNEDPVVLKNSFLTTSAFVLRRLDNTGDIRCAFLVRAHSGGGPGRDGARVCFYGSAKIIKKFISEYNAEMEKYLEAYLAAPFPFSNQIRTIIPTGFIPLKEYVSLPDAGNQPPMPESCCESLKADIEDIKEVLATNEILAGKMTFPWKWRMPGGEGEEVIMDYPNLARAVAQMIDHLGIHPPKLAIKDINNAIAGDQGLSNQFPSATQGFEALMSQVWDANADVDTLTNILYRLSWLNVQQTMNLAQVSAKVQTISDMLGGKTEPRESSITTPFNIGAGVVEKSTKGQGFGKIDNKIEANTEIATESLLPNFLKIRENPIVTEIFSGDVDLNDKIDMIIMKLESLQRG
jgi:hypothetical protein